MTEAARDAIAAALIDYWSKRINAEPKWRLAGFSPSNKRDSYVIRHRPIVSTPRLEESDDVFVVEFEVYTVVAVTGHPGLWIEELEPSGRCGLPTDDFAKAEIFLAGDLKWDGCSNLAFYPQTNTMLHLCGVKDVTAVGELMANLYEIAREEYHFDV